VSQSTCTASLAMPGGLPRNLLPSSVALLPALTSIKISVTRGWGLRHLPFPPAPATLLWQTPSVGGWLMSPGRDGLARCPAPFVHRRWAWMPGWLTWCLGSVGALGSRQAAGICPSGAAGGTEMNNLGKVPPSCARSPVGGRAWVLQFCGRSIPRAGNHAVFTFCLLGQVGFFFFVFPFPPACVCLWVLSFRPGWESAGVFLLTLIFH
jgi:hypothetical protein